MRITETNGNSKNGIRGERITIYATINNKDIIVDRFNVTSMYGAKNYCKKHLKGEYSKRYFAAIEKAKELENK